MISQNLALGEIVLSEINRNSHTRLQHSAKIITLKSKNRSFFNSLTCKKKNPGENRWGRGSCSNVEPTREKISTETQKQLEEVRGKGTRDDGEETWMTCSPLWEKGIKIKRQYTICSIQRLNHHNPGSNPLALLCYLTHRSSLMLLECFYRLQPFSLRRLMTAFAPLFTGLCHHSDLHGLVVFFRCLRVHSLLVLKAAPEEGEHGV